MIETLILTLPEYPLDGGILDQDEPEPDYIFTKEEI
jgi:hypothetical protein